MTKKIIVFMGETHKIHKIDPNEVFLMIYFPFKVFLSNFNLILLLHLVTFAYLMFTDGGNKNGKTKNCKRKKKKNVYLRLEYYHLNRHHPEVIDHVFPMQIYLDIHVYNVIFY